MANGIATDESELVILALYAPGEPVDPSDGAALRITDSDGDGLISTIEFRNATGILGFFGLNGGGEALLFDATGFGNNNGNLYGPRPVLAGTDLNSFIDALPPNFPPVDPTEVETNNPTQPPGNNPVCFAAGTMIATPEGERPVETLVPGDMVLTRDFGAQPVRWMGLRRYTSGELESRPAFRPIRIAAGALGAGTPASDLVISPQHRILMSNRIARRMFGTAEILVAAKKLTGLRGVSVEPPGQGVTYVHIAFDAHQIVTANGAAAESLLPGPVAMGALDAEAQRELAAIFTDLAGMRPRPARMVPPGRRVARLIERQLRNDRPAVE